MAGCLQQRPRPAVSSSTALSVEREVAPFCLSVKFLKSTMEDKDYCGRYCRAQVRSNNLIYIPKDGKAEEFLQHAEGFTDGNKP